MADLQLSKLLGSHDAAPLSRWRPGFWRRLPWPAMLGLIATLVAAAFMVKILLSSNDRAIDDWINQPTVLLAITYTIANVCLQYALGQAITITWWLRALEGDAPVRELHNMWAFGDGLKAILFSGRSFNFVALTALLITVAPINGPLLQRASVIGTRGGYNPVNVTIPIAKKTILTGSITGRYHESNALTPAFRTVINQHTKRDLINITNSGCIGTCKGHVLGAGYDIQCNETLVPYDRNNEHPNGTARDTRLDCFATTFSYQEEYMYPNKISFTAGFKRSENSTGNMTWRSCFMWPATVAYPIILENDTIFS
jgi:hypothetical protein